ncbi:PilZ domain-containing protein [Nitrospira sp. Nam74]
MSGDAITVLLASEQAEDVKVITKSLRSFYPGCRVEVVYSSEEALEWASKQDWHIVILDEAILTPHIFDTLQEMRRRAARSALIVAAGRQDTIVALDLIRQGADYALFKNTPAFLTELPLVTREVLEKRDIRARLDLSQDRYLRLIDTVTDMAYELDAEGRFLYVSHEVRSLLHYDPQALIGLHYSTLIPPEDLTLADRRFNERRSKSRATRRFKLRLLDKDPGLAPVMVEINATALYDRHRQFIGTVGIVSPTAGQQYLQALQRLTDLPSSLTHILANVEQLLQTVRGLCEQAGPSALPLPTRASLYETAAGEVVAGPPTEPSEQPAHGTREVSPPFEERRRSSRIVIDMDARVASNGTSWEGTALNISLGGIFILVKGEVRAREAQVTRLGFASDVGVLEIAATIRDIRAMPGKSSASKRPVSGLAIQFSSLKEVEARILHSLIEGLRAGSISIRCTVLLIRHPPDSEDTPNPKIEGTAEPADISGDQPTDRRQATRVNLALPVQVEVSPSTASTPSDTSITNLSVGGACLRLESSLDIVGQQLTVRFSTPAEASPQSAMPTETTEYRLTGEVMWATPAPGAARRVDSSGRNPLRVGVRFLHEPKIQPGLTALVGRYLIADRIPRSDNNPAIATEFLECTNEHGQRIAISYDALPEHLPNTAPVIVIAPGYGRTKREYIELAYYLASNGCRVLRYDHGRHVGESHGGMVLTRLTGMQDDLHAVLDYAVHRWPTSPIALIASDVTARVAIKTARSRAFMKLLVLLAPVVDLQYTLMAVHQEDLISASLQGVKRGISNILGFNVDADAWLSDAIDGGYADFDSTLEDLATLRMPVLVFSSEQDLWIRPNSLPRIKATLADTRLYWHAIPEARHGVVDQPNQARRLFREMVAQCRILLSAVPPGELKEPSRHNIGHQGQLELERARGHHQMDQATAIQFWHDYLDRSHSLVNFSEYWHLLDHIHRLLGPIRNNARVLDAGCGNGNFGMFLLIAGSFRSGQLFGEETRLHYIGMDLVPSGLRQAKTNLIRVAAELRGKFASAVRPQSIMKASLACMDLNAPLPFHDAHFDHIVCNLVLGYLRDPLFTLRELVRVLVPGGKLILTHFKPQADLTQIYRKFVGLAKRDSERQQATEAAEASGTITQYPCEGAFRFFDRQELAMLLMSSGASQPRIYSTFSNQAYLALAEKSPFITPSE